MRNLLYFYSLVIISSLVCQVLGSEEVDILPVPAMAAIAIPDPGGPAASVKSSSGARGDAICRAHFHYHEIKREIVDGTPVITTTTGMEHIEALHQPGVVLELGRSEGAEENFMHALFSRIDHPTMKAALQNYPPLPEAINGEIILTQHSEGLTRIRKYPGTEVKQALDQVASAATRILEEDEKQKDEQHAASLVSSSSRDSTGVVTHIKFPYLEIIIKMIGGRPSITKKEGCDFIDICRRCDPESGMEHIEFPNSDDIPPNIVYAFFSDVAKRTGKKEYLRLRPSGKGLPDASRDYYILTHHDSINGTTQRYYPAARVNVSIDFGVRAVLQAQQAIKESHLQFNASHKKGKR